MRRHVVFGELGPAGSGAVRHRRSVVALPVGELGSTAMVAALTPKFPRFVGD